MFLLLVVLILITLFFPLPAHASRELPGPYTATVIEVIDGDTIRARIQIWLGQEIETLIRIDGIDTPEIKSQCSTEHEMALQAREKLNELIGGKIVSIYNIKYGKYAGRILAEIKTPAGNDIASLLLSDKLAHEYKGKKRGSWC